MGLEPTSKTCNPLRTAAPNQYTSASVRSTFLGLLVGHYNGMRPSAMLAYYFLNDSIMDMNN